MALLDKLKIGGTVYDAWATKDQVGSANDASSATTVFGKIKAIIDYLVGIVTTAPYAKEATVSAAKASADHLASFFNITEALPEYTALTPAEAIAIARDCQYNVMGTDWPIPTWLPTGVTEAQVESAAEGLGIPYHEPTQTA